MARRRLTERPAPAPPRCLPPPPRRWSAGGSTALPRPPPSSLFSSRGVGRVDGGSRRLPLVRRDVLLMKPRCDNVRYAFLQRTSVKWHIAWRHRNLVIASGKCLVITRFCQNYGELPRVTPPFNTRQGRRPSSDDLERVLHVPRILAKPRNCHALPEVVAWFMEMFLWLSGILLQMIDQPILLPFCT